MDPSDCASSFTVPPGYIDDRRLEAQSAIVNLPLAYTAVTGTSINSVSTSASATSLATSSATATQSGDSSDVLKVGLSAGLGVGIPLLLALAISLFFLHRSNKQLNGLNKQQRMMGPHTGSEGGYNEVNEHPSVLGYNNGMTGRNKPAEMDSSQVHEAPMGR